MSTVNVNGCVEPSIHLQISIVHFARVLNVEVFRQYANVFVIQLQHHLFEDAVHELLGVLGAIETECLGLEVFPVLDGSQVDIILLLADLGGEHIDSIILLEGEQHPP